MVTPSSSNRAKYETAREMAFGTITNAFTRLGTTFDAQPRVVYVQNFTDTIMDFSISFSGLTTCFSLAAGGAFTTDIVANGAGSLFTPVSGESIWVKYRSAPSSGFVQMSCVVAA